MKKIVISGSISLLEKMKNISSQLTDMGYMVTQKKVAYRYPSKDC